MATNLLNYTDYDFDNLVSQLQDRLKLRDAWKDAYVSSTGEMLIEFYAFVANLVLYYLERRAEECYLDTAQNYSSVVNLVKLINYSVKRKTSATGTLRFTIATKSSVSVGIPIGVICSSSDGTEYFVGEKSTDPERPGVIRGGGAIAVGDTSVDLKAIQGKMVVKEITSNGAANQVYFISDTDTENDIFQVEIDEIRDVDNPEGNWDEWEKVSSFIASETDDEHFTLIQELDNSLTLRFGNGTQGKAPPLNSKIRITYVKTVGEKGNIFLPDKITTIESTIFDANTDVVTNISVTNPEDDSDSDDTTIFGFEGGDSEESIEEIKSEAPRVFATGDRAVTRNDFIAILENMSDVANANVWGENEESPPNYDLFNTVRLCILRKSWEGLTTTREGEIATALYNQSVITVKYEFIDPVILDIVPVLEVVVNQGESLTETQANIIAALLARFQLGTTTKLGTPKYHSNLVDIVDSLSAVKYHHMTLEIRQEIDGSGTSYSDTLEATEVLEESVKVYVGDTQVGIDDGSEAFTVLEAAYNFTGTINYTTGVITLSFDSTPSDTVYVRYQQDEDGDIIVSNRQVCRMYNSTVDMTSIALDS